MNHKIAVFGTGANGSCIAANLVDAGLDVTLIDQWPAHVEAMRAGGLRIAMRDAELHVKVRAHHLCDLCTLNVTFDVVLLVIVELPLVHGELTVQYTAGLISGEVKMWLPCPPT